MQNVAGVQFNSWYKVFSKDSSSVQFSAVLAGMALPLLLEETVDICEHCPNSAGKEGNRVGWDCPNCDE